MKQAPQITDEQLILLYYGELEDPDLAARVANDPQLAARLDDLTSSLNAMDAFTAPSRTDYGGAVWQQISSRLEPQSRANRRLSWLWQPQFSMAGVAGIVAVALLAFWLGKESRAPSSLVDSESVLNIERLIAAQVADHLSATDMLFTQVRNSHLDIGLAETESDWAAQLLRSNRIYRRAANGAGHRRLALLLDEIEPLLLELAHADSDITLQDDEPSNADLMLRVRVMNQKLAQDSQSI